MKGGRWWEREREVVGEGEGGGGRGRWWDRQVVGEGGGAWEKETFMTCTFYSAHLSIRLSPIVFSSPSSICLIPFSPTILNLNIRPSDFPSILTT
ncbi:hypothetical protein Pmani_034476 [Petrolisthes manimaculis]|uniref:Uncharacterized protein n=1 Tax=Petrolisthes manimaculis TaxID=1843537 RepID=A0AAE1NPC0_9EUCA|nr:hypothetical protein Pmani_034476 [Petrolisthes manimaculis]